MGRTLGSGKSQQGEAAILVPFLMGLEKMEGRGQIQEDWGSKARGGGEED